LPSERLTLPGEETEVDAQRTLITGGAGFIGANLANRLLGQGHQVTILDNLSRAGCRSNLDWLRAEHGPDSFRLIPGSVTDADIVRDATDRVERIYHLAGQVAVSTSVKAPREDFEANALGTFNVLDAARQVGDDPVFIYASTNKVYGSLEGVEVQEEATRYRFSHLTCGIPETQPLDFHSPYGCSKGAGDQYVRDYARIYGLRTVVVRQSCIYGYRQFGIEDQGWLAWFIVAALKGQPIWIYGNGKQVRDVLFVEDLLDAYDAATEHIDVAAGQVFNVGGGADNTISIWAEFGPLLGELLGRRLDVSYCDARPGDQPIYVSDIRKASRLLGWHPQVTVESGVRRLFEWVSCNAPLFSHL
jgi:CDP-paratose 2-epimerase